MSARAPPVAGPKKKYSHLPLLCIGSSHGRRVLISNCEGASIFDTCKKLHFDDLPLPGAESGPDPVVPYECGGCWQHPDSRGRVRLTNTACMRWANGTCCHGHHCIFLHEEKPLPSILYTGEEPIMMRRVEGQLGEPVAKSRPAPIEPGSLKDVRIYLSNLPSRPISDHMTNTEWLRQFATQYGEVQVVELVS